MNLIHLISIFDTARYNLLHDKSAHVENSGNSRRVMCRTQIAFLSNLVCFTFIFFVFFVLIAFYHSFDAACLCSSYFRRLFWCVFPHLLDSPPNSRLRILIKCSKYSWMKARWFTRKTIKRWRNFFWK